MFTSIFLLLSVVCFICVSPVNLAVSYFSIRRQATSTLHLTVTINFPTDFPAYHILLTAPAYGVQPIFLSSVCPVNSYYLFNRFHFLGKNSPKLVGT